MSQEYPGQIKARFEQGFVSAVQDAFQRLLEQKHLYQNTMVAIAPDLQALLKANQYLSHDYARYAMQPWSPVTGAVARIMENVTYFMLPSIKTFCKRCGERFPFNLVSADTTPGAVFSVSKEGMERIVEMYSQGTSRVENFVLSYSCQGCKGTPEVFIVRREDLKLQLCGRSPIEHVSVPKFIPRKEEDWYSGALTAFQSGQELAGLFLLRTFIEQFARRQTGSRVENGQALMDTYMALLPAAVKDSLPSLRNLYDKISGALHAADPTLAPFEAMRRNIDRHFDGRRVHEVPDVTVPVK